MNVPGWIRPIDEVGVEIDLLVVPRASRTRVVGEHDSRLRVQVSAPPVDGEANDALVRFLASLLGVRRSDVEVSSGQTGRRKTVRVHGVSVAAVLPELAA